VAIAGQALARTARLYHEWRLRRRQGLVVAERQQGLTEAEACLVDACPTALGRGRGPPRSPRPPTGSPPGGPSCRRSTAAPTCSLSRPRPVSPPGENCPLITESARCPGVRFRAVLTAEIARMTSTERGTSSTSGTAKRPRRLGRRVTARTTRQRGPVARHSGLGASLARGKRRSQDPKIPVVTSPGGLPGILGSWKSWDLALCRHGGQASSSCQLRTSSDPVAL
jgi:hypothetical protein